MLVEIIHSVRRLYRDYGRELAVALLLHLLLLLMLLQARFTPRLAAPATEPVMSYLYQPSASTPVEPTAEPAAVVTQPPANNIKSAISAQVDTATDVVTPTVTTTMQTPALSITTPAQPEQMAATPRPGVAQRALQHALTTDPAAIGQAAAFSYQQFLQAEQSAKLTVAPRHQQLSQDPAQQVYAQLDNGYQLIRVKGGCRFADPSKEGFDALMAANAVVPCGDEENSSALLKQTLEKHLKR